MIRVTTTYAAPHMHTSYTTTGVKALYSGHSIEDAGMALYSGGAFDGVSDMVDADYDTQLAVWAHARLLEAIGF
jgi:hypothetical protein